MFGKAKEKEKKTHWVKGKSKGKFGKFDGKGKGFGKKGQAANQSVYCHYCGKQGHMKKDCFKYFRKIRTMAKAVRVLAL